MPNRSLRRRDRVSRWSWALADAAIWYFAIYAAAWLRLDFDTTPVLVRSTLVFASVAAGVHVLIGAVLGPYRVGHLRGSFEETSDIARALSLTSGGIFVWALLSPTYIVPRTVPLIGGALALAGMFASRFLIRSWRNRSAVHRPSDKRVVIFGAGEAGQRLLRSMMRDPHSGYFPVALLDDDRRKRRLRIDGVAVRGTRDDIDEVARAYDATALVVALPQADSTLIRELTDRAAAAGLDTMILPPLHAIIGGRPTSRDLRDVNVEDLLGRRPIKLDTSAIAEQIAGRRVLVTGAGGSIGSELCRQIARFGPAKLYHARS